MLASPKGDNQTRAAQNRAYLLELFEARGHAHDAKTC